MNKYYPPDFDPAKVSMDTHTNLWSGQVMIVYFNDLWNAILSPLLCSLLRLSSVSSMAPSMATTTPTLSGREPRNCHRVSLSSGNTRSFNVVVSLSLSLSLSPPLHTHTHTYHISLSNTVYTQTHPSAEPVPDSGSSCAFRFEMPYNIWCDGCGNHIGMGEFRHLTSVP